MFGYPGLGVVANHLPAASASGSKETVDGFNVWSINGYRSVCSLLMRLERTVIADTSPIL